MNVDQLDGRDPLSGLARLSPDPGRTERTRRACLARLARPTVAKERRRAATLAWGRAALVAAGTVLCVLYLAVLVVTSWQVHTLKR